jgi:molybdate transport system permease protein
MDFDQQGLSSILISLKVISLAMILVLILGVIFALLLTQFKFKGKKVIESLLTLPLVLPPTVLGYYLILLLGRQSFLGRIIYELTEKSIVFTWFAAALASFIVSLPLMIKTTMTAMNQIDPNLIHTSYLLGYNKWTTAWRIILPLSKNGILAGLVLSFARGLGEFGATLMFAGNIQGVTTTMPLAIYSYATAGEYAKANTLAVILTLFSLGFLYVSNFLLKKRKRL